MEGRRELNTEENQFMDMNEKKDNNMYLKIISKQKENEDLSVTTPKSHSRRSSGAK
jgi:hypothetical protein